jgi:hypothetical protein
MSNSKNAVVLVTITFLVVALISSFLSVTLSDVLAKPKQPGKVDCGLVGINNKVRCCQVENVNADVPVTWCTICIKKPNETVPHDCGPRFRLEPSGVVGGLEQPPLKTEQSPPSFHQPPSTSSSHPSIRAQ